MRAVGRRRLEAAAGVVPNVLRGVQLRMDSPDRRQQAVGMRAAEAMAGVASAVSLVWPQLLVCVENHIGCRTPCVLCGHRPNSCGPEE